VAAEPGRPRAPMDLREQRGALLRLGLVVVAGVVVAAYFGALATLLVVFCLVFMIILHELGHFATAKWAGMKVSEFFVGFGPRLWSVTKGETTYGIKALPLGGYCRIVGMTSAEQVSPADEPRAYRNQATWKRLVVVSAGSFVHFCLAFTLLFWLFLGPGDIGNFIANPPASIPIGSVTAFANGKSPAQKAGLKPGDVIVAIDGHHFSTWEQERSFISARPGERVTIEWRSGKALHYSAVVLANAARARFAGSSTAISSKPEGFLGIAVGAVRYGLAGSLEHAGEAFGSTVANSVKTIGQVIGNLGGYLHMVENQKAAASGKRFVSPIGVVVLANEATQVGLSEVLYLLILINIFVGIFNMVPLLPMDGGHVVVALYEKLRSLFARRPYHADVNKMVPVLYAVVLVLVFYAVTAMFMDLRQALS
jgi:membrane-associated protease RseP (regulator of RpoE activity)